MQKYIGDKKLCCKLKECLMHMLLSYLWISYLLYSNGFQRLNIYVMCHQFPVTNLHCINLFEVYNSCINHPSLNFHSVFNGPSTKYLLQIGTLQKLVVVIILKQCLKSRNLDIKCNIVQKRISILIDELNNLCFSRYNT